MALSARSSLASGIAALGAGAMTVGLVQPAPQAVAPASHRTISSLAVDLAAAIDPITPWVDTIKTSLGNLRSLTGLYWQQPFPLLATIARNQLTYLRELPNIGLIAGQVVDNAKTFFTAPYDSTPNNISDALITDVQGLPVSQQSVYGLLQTILAGGRSPVLPLVDLTATRSPQLQSLLPLTATPVSGELIGLLGPVISPVIQLTESFTAIGRYWQKGDVRAGLDELINVPANVTNAFLNGGKYLDLTGVVTALGFSLPPEITSVGINMGGLLNVVPTAWEPPTVPSSDIHPYSGGLAFDAVATEVNSLLTFTDPGWPVGAIGSVIGLGQALGDAMLVTPPTPAATKPAAATASVAVEVPVPAAVDSPRETPVVPEITSGATTPETPDAVAEAPAPRVAGRASAGHATAGADGSERASSRGMSRSGARHAD